MCCQTGEVALIWLADTVEEIKRMGIKFIKHKQRCYIQGTHRRNIHIFDLIKVVSWTPVVMTHVRPDRLCLHPGLGCCLGVRLSVGLRYSTTTWQQVGLQTLVCHINTDTGPRWQNSWGPHGSCRPLMCPMWAPWILLSRSRSKYL